MNAHRCRGLGTRFCCAALAAVLCVVAGCARDHAVAIVRGVTMGTYYEIKWCARAGVGNDTVRQAAEAVFADADAAFSTWNPRSVISRFNAHASTEPFVVDAAHRAHFVEVLRLALAVAERTGGAFDPTVQPLVELRGFGAQAVDDPPRAEEIDALRPRIGWWQVWIDEQDRLCKARADIAITFSAVVPGWAADRVADGLTALGIEGCMVDVGGEIACRGEKAVGVPWTIGIARPTPPGAPERVHVSVPLRGALATSGSYRTIHVEGDRVVHHVFDPRTLQNPTHPWVSVSVLVDRCGLADALATALLVLGPDGTPPVVEAYRDRGLRVLFLGVPGAGGVVPERRFGW